MRRPEIRHYSEEELLVHILEEETPELAQEISSHLRACGECDAIFKDYVEVVNQIRSWSVLEPAEDVWRAQKASLLAQYRQDFAAGRMGGLLSAFFRSLQTGWNYALDHPLPALGLVAVALTFAMERTITTFRLDRVLPGASEVLQILKQIL